MSKCSGDARKLSAIYCRRPALNEETGPFEETALVLRAWIGNITLIYRFRQGKKRSSRRESYNLLKRKKKLNKNLKPL